MRSDDPDRRTIIRYPWRLVVVILILAWSYVVVPILGFRRMGILPTIPFLALLALAFSPYVRWARRFVAGVSRNDSEGDAP